MSDDHRRLQAAAAAAVPRVARDAPTPAGAKHPEVQGPPHTRRSRLNTNVQSITIIFFYLKNNLTY